MLLEDRKPQPGEGAPEAQQPREAPRRDQSSSAPPAATPENPPRRARWGRRRALFNFATVIVTIGFSYIALSGIKPAAAWHALKTCDYWWLLPALVAFGLGNVARTMRWRSLFAPGRRPPPGPTGDAMMVGYFYNNILPARAGEAVRVVVLTQRSAAPPVEIVGTVVLERLFDVLAILVVFFAAEPWLPQVSWFGPAAAAAAVLAVGIAFAAAVLAIYGDRPLRLLLRPLGRLPMFSGERLDRTVAELAHGLSGLRDIRVAGEAFMWTILAWMASSLCAYLVSLAFALHLPFAAGVLVTVAIGFGMILPAAPAAVGVFEGAVLIALSAYGIPHSAALPYALVLHAVNFVPFIVIGVLLLQYNASHPVRRVTAVETPAPAAAPAAS
jgi:glycosyltransferase 2 family protein